MKQMQQLLFPFTTKNILQFIVILFCIGFSLGTIVLIYPIHWVSDYVIAENWSSTSEKLLIKFLIIIYLVLSFVIAVWLLRRLLKSKKNSHKIIVFVSLILITSFFLWLWFNPDLMGKTNRDKIASENTASAEFFFGSYPSESTLFDLKDEGYTLVISLLHPTVIPFEPKLIIDEEKYAKTVGIKYIHIPMLPWISDNTDAITKIKEIIKTEKGKIYVHCYLGKDRVNVVKNIIKNNNGFIDKSTEPESKRKLDDITKFERGEIFKLAPDVFLVPFPGQDWLVFNIIDKFLKLPLTVVQDSYLKLLPRIPTIIQISEIKICRCIN